MRVGVRNASLALGLCDYLSLQGWVAVEASEDEADERVKSTAGDNDPSRLLPK